MNGQIDIIKEWIEKGDHDLGSAKIIFLHLPDYFDKSHFIVSKQLKSI
jgi:hypothetical protein